ncbi:MAG TPA: Gfo/Idh/MocA family oxidoreductase [Kofleriaceae bacterium]|nr:Gfo/Idh/MocA family oxidoreductase [Kofleriaceae bacterium]
MPSPLKGAIVGFGFIAERGHLPAYLAHPERFEITAVADLCPARREIARRALPRARIYDRTETMLASEALDFVDIATPPSEHAAICHGALDHGLHVFCEKPLATSAKEAMAMLAHAARARRVVFPSHNYRHAPVIRKIREILDAGELGEIHLVTLQTLRPTHAKGVSEWLPDWRRDPRYAGGGIAMDHASHSFYLAFDWLGAFPTSVTAHLEYRAGLETEDGFTCTATFPKGTAVSYLTWNAGVRKVLYSLHGARGALTVEDDDIQLSLRGAGGVERLTAASNWMDASHAAWFSTLQAEFLDAIRTEQFVGKHAVDALQSIRWIEAAYASAREGSRVLAIPPVQAPPSLLRSLAG